MAHWQKQQREEPETSSVENSPSLRTDSFPHQPIRVMLRELRYRCSMTGHKGAVCSALMALYLRTAGLLLVLMRATIDVMRQVGRRQCLL